VLAVVAWDAAQRQFCQERYTQTDFLLMLRDAVPVGRLSIASWQDAIRIVDIALLPPSRTAGIGTALRRALLAAAAVAHQPVRLHVEKVNPALRLYERLGFVPIEDKGVYLFMEWTPRVQRQAP
jgi:ribosomal protein S18 acetylase RimI-like enzyme